MMNLFSVVGMMNNYATLSNYATESGAQYVNKMLCFQDLLYHTHFLNSGQH